GVTEYNADYIQLREGLISMKDYAAVIKSKLNGSSRYNDTLPFTEMSKGALDKYEPQYTNVYIKGALIGLCLDILIRQESNGSQGLQDVINALVLRYGKEKSFKDEELFGEIIALTSPKIGEFFNRYVAGPEKIPYSEILEKAGFNLIKNPYNVIDMKGSLDIGFNQNTFRLKINKLNFTESTFINELRIKAGDELISFNGNQISFQNARNIFGSAKNNVKAGDKFELVVARTDANGKENQVTLKAIVKDVKTAYDFDVKINDKPDAQQMMLKNAWLGK
ncbi:MAG: peptidase M61, partial [Ignavibacteria bacterium]|nr:peptidase M61 [Ignavibacteria bacterium]